MVAEFETDEVPEVDPISVAVCPMIAAVCELTADGSAERKAVLIEVLESAERIRAALRPKPRFH
jgi:hypothetical protein